MNSLSDHFDLDQSSIDGHNGSNYLDMSRSFDDSTSNDSINVTINIVDDSGAIIGHLSGSMHLSDLNISNPSLLNISGSTTLPDESFTLGEDHSYSFNFSNNSLTGNLTTSMHLSELGVLSLNSTAITDRESSSFVGTSFGGKRRRKKRTLKKKRSRKNKKRSRSRR